MSVSTSTGTINKRPSRSNSISSSVVTVKKSASVSSRTNPRTSYLGTGSTSPDSTKGVLHTLNNSRSDFRTRAEILESRKGGGGLGVHRWSHSTSSSLSAIDVDLIQRRTSSLRKSSGYTASSITPNSQSRNSPDHRLDKRGSSKRSSSASNQASSRTGSRLAFRDSSNLSIVQGVPQKGQPASPTRQPVSTWEQNTGVNKFGERVQGIAIQYTASGQSTGQASGSPVSKAQRNNRVDSQSKSLQTRDVEPMSGRQRDIVTTPRQTVRHDPPRMDPSRRAIPAPAETRSPRRRDMLSRALAKANEAVLLDNAQNVNAAIEAYNEACELLQQVMLRSADLADRRKLSSIKATYSKRIAELHDFDNTFVDLMKPLPGDAPADEYENPEDFYQEDASYQSATANEAPVIQLPLRQESLLPEIFGGENYIHNRALPPVPPPMPSSRLNLPMDEQFMPAPLSPRPPPAHEDDDQDLVLPEVQSEQRSMRDERLSGEAGPSTWLDQPDGLSSAPSSRESSVDYGRNEGQLMAAMEDEFDSMNAAVESAYDELDQEATPRNAERSMQLDGSNRFDPLTGTHLDDDAEEEEQLLEDMVQHVDLGETQSDQHTLSTLPRQSDSSGFSGRTWGSSVASTTATTRTTLSTLAESIEPPLHAPPSAALPEPPAVGSKAAESEKASLASQPSALDKHVGIRDRRMSGQGTKQLKIETFNKRNSIAQQMKSTQPAHESSLGEESGEVSKENATRTLAPAASFTSSVSGGQLSTPLPSVHSGDLPGGEVPSTPALTQGTSVDDGNSIDPSPSRNGKTMPPPAVIPRKNLSSATLGKSSLSINTGSMEADSPITPGSAMFSNDARRPPSAAGPGVPNSNPGSAIATSVSLGGMYLFDNLVGDSRSPRSPHSGANEPASLEPCPDSFLLRPFWLMRCLYQAFSHPRGGYVSTKLFIPRDIWRVRNVKIRAVDDKVAQCDLLTAALQKLAKVDTLDANAVLEELQSFETILEQVRTTLSKKLGNEVGLSGSSTIFKGSPATEDPSDHTLSRSGNTSTAAKTIASGWRKLRSKSSSANLNTAPKTDVSAQNLTMASLPMTSSASVITSRSNARNRYPPPTPSALPQLTAPHAFYIAALSRLFEAVQILDSIARQVEDPGLKCSSQTHVGLELSVRNAAEFFAFYVLRFVMGDLLMLLDKFLKRGGEWVMV